MTKKTIKLTLRFEKKDGDTVVETLEKVIEGDAAKIDFALGDGGIIDSEIKEFLEY